METARAPQVVVGVDGSPGSTEALVWAAQFAVHTGVALRVVTVTELPSVYAAAGVAVMPPTESLNDIVRQGELTNAAAVGEARAMAPGLTVDGVPTVGGPAHELVANAQPGDTLVVAASSHTGRLSNVLGSVATAVAHHAHGPVVVVHGKVERGEVPRRIAVGVDGWPESDAALAWAFQTARLLGASVTLVHAWEYPYLVHRRHESSALSAMRKDAAELMDSVQMNLTVEERAMVSAAVVEEGPPAQVLVEQDADLVVVGSRGRGGVRSFLLGSVSRQVLQHAQGAVAVIRGVPDD